MSMRDLILAHAPRSAMAKRLADVGRPRVECFYFGYSRGSGHVFCTPRGGVDYAIEREANAAFGRGIDTFLCWNGPKTDRDNYAQRDETEGRAFRTWRMDIGRVLGPQRRSARGIQHRLHRPRRLDILAGHPRSEARLAASPRFTFPVVEVNERGQEVAR